MTEDVPVVGAMVAAPAEGEFDAFHPRHVSPLVAALSSADCSVSGKVFAVHGGQITELEGWRQGASQSTEGDWDPADVLSRLG
jgi:hypothetical protein